MEHASPQVCRPESEAELLAALKSIPDGQTLTFRGGGQSLDAQSLNSQHVIVMDAACFSYICDPVPEPDGTFHIKTGAGARWWDVVAKVAPLGFFPPSMATAADATVGGTLSADCVSRMSAIYGKEGEQIRSFKLVLPNGTARCLSRWDTGEDARLFNAVIGGFGYLGAVTEVSFDLVPTGLAPTPAPHFPRVQTRSTRHSANVDWGQLLRGLREKSLLERSRVWEIPPSSKSCGKRRASAPLWSALSVASYLCGEGMTANLLEQRFVGSDQPLHPTPGDIYNPEPKITVTAAELSAWWPTLVELASDLGFPNGEFTDDLFGWAFFFGNWATRAKLCAHAQGYRLNFTQHTFALPATSAGGLTDTRPACRFIAALQARLHASDVRPPSIDLLYVPGDRFLMSASRGMDAYLVTISLATFGRDSHLPQVHDMLCGLARDCRSLGGRVHLVKSVVADAEDLRAMYGESAQEFKDLKRLYDPKNLLRNDFFRRVFEA